MRIDPENQMIQAQLKAGTLAGKLEILNELYNDICNEISTAYDYFDPINEDFRATLVEKMEKHDYIAVRHLLKQFALGEI